MSIWDNLTNAGQNVVGAAKDMLAVTRLNGQKAEVKKTLDRQYRDLGEKFIELYGDNVEEALEGQAREIKISLDQVRAIDQQIADIRGKKLCPFCEKPLQEGALFCSFCGRRLTEADEIEKAEAQQESASEPEPVPEPEPEPEPEPAPPAKPVCPFCGGENREGSVFCMHCGKKMVE